jgi:hypothetical protein
MGVEIFYKHLHGSPLRGHVESLRDSISLHADDICPFVCLRAPPAVDARFARTALLAGLVPATMREESELLESCQMEIGWGYEYILGRLGWV